MHQCLPQFEPPEQAVLMIHTWRDRKKLSHGNGYLYLRYISKPIFVNSVVVIHFAGDKFQLILKNYIITIFCLFSFKKRTFRYF